MPSKYSLSDYLMGYLTAIFPSTTFAVVWIVLILGGSSQPQPTTHHECTVPPGMSLHAENSQMFVDRTGQIFCATRAQTSIGGVVWTMDGNTTRILLGDSDNPEEFFGNGELVVWPDGYLRYITVRVRSLTPPRIGTHIVEHIVPEWTP